MNVGAAHDQSVADDGAYDPAQAAREVEARVKAAGSSFYWGMRSLPANRRAVLYAIYAFCRAVDDVADSERPLAEKRRELDVWRARIDALYQGRAGEAITAALCPAIDAYALRHEDFHAVIDGMEMDAGEPIRAPDAATLDLYCDRAASAVGRLCVRAFGAPGESGDVVAHHLGRALQLTNILRDVDEDAARGRLYLPEETLAAHGIDIAAARRDPAAAVADPGVDAACHEIARCARGHFEAAWTAMRRCPRGTMRPARMMGGIYRGILDRLESRGWAAPRVSLHLSAASKLGLALRYALM